MKRRRERMEKHLKKHAGEREVKEFENYLKEHPEDADEAYFLPPGPDEKPDPPCPNVTTNCSSRPSRP